MELSLLLQLGAQIEGNSGINWAGMPGLVEALRSCITGKYLGQCERCLAILIEYLSTPRAIFTHAKDGFQRVASFARKLELLLQSFRLKLELELFKSFVTYCKSE